MTCMNDAQKKHERNNVWVPKQTLCVWSKVRMSGNDGNAKGFLLMRQKMYFEKVWNTLVVLHRYSSLCKLIYTLRLKDL